MTDIINKIKSYLRDVVVYLLKLRIDVNNQNNLIIKNKILTQILAYSNKGLEWESFHMRKKIFGEPKYCSPPIKKIPQNLIDKFTMNGIAEIEESWEDRTYPDNWPLIYCDFEINYYMKQIKNKKSFVYGMTDVWLQEGFKKYPIKNKNVVNMGSLTPWYESMCLVYGAKSTTIDYNKIISFSKKIKTITINDWEKSKVKFDVALSISSFEHDGLGMYGDPIDPDGDLKAMKKMKKILKKNGILFLSIPIGKDKILWNNARIYGKFRLKKLIKEWKLLDTFGLQEIHLNGPGHIQPIFVLENK